MTEALWTGDALVAATGGRPLGDIPAAIRGVSIDTRTLQPGEAFFAIRGDTHDGHDFATAAMAAGASVIVVAEHKLPAMGRLHIPKIVVPDVLRSLELTGIAARERSGAKVVAVTGSVGKTSTKEALRHALATLGKVHASEKSFNNHWGVPLTLARLPADADYAIFEIGMNHSGEIRPLVRMVRPHVAIVTLIAPAHLGHFRDLDEIAVAKAEIFEGVEPGGAALVNRDDERWQLLAKLARSAGVKDVLGFGEHPDADARLLSYENDGYGSSIRASIRGRELDVRVGAPGRHVVQNALAVLGTAGIIGADLDRVAVALATLIPETGRGRRYQLALPGGGTFTVIDESYNANPASMEAALDLLHTSPVEGQGRRIAVLGDMLELGVHAQRLHAGLAELVNARRIDLVLLAGPEMKALADRLAGGPPTEYRQNVDELKPVLMDTVRAGDTVMIKSSKGVGFSKLVEALKSEFPAQAARAAHG